MIGIDDQARARRENVDRANDALGGMKGDEGLDSCDNCVRLLIGDQSERDFGGGGGRDYGLGSGAREAASDAVDLHRGARPDALKHASVGLSGERRGTDFIA